MNRVRPGLEMINNQAALIVDNRLTMPGGHMNSTRERMESELRAQDEEIGQRRAELAVCLDANHAAREEAYLNGYADGLEQGRQLSLNTFCDV